MKIIAVMNYKGGVGKTTLTANLAARLAESGSKVLMIDVDPQASLTFSFVSPEYWQDNLSESKTIRQIFANADQNTNLDDLIVYPEEMALHLDTTAKQGKLGLIASDLNLIDIDMFLASKLIAKITKREFLRISKDLEEACSMESDHEKSRQKRFLFLHSILRKAISRMKSEFDYVLIDCPPNFYIITKNAIAASDYVLIPAKSDYLSTLGIDYLRKSMDKLCTEYNTLASNYSRQNGIQYSAIHPEIMGIVFSMVQLASNNKPIIVMREYQNRVKNLDFFVFRSQIKNNPNTFAAAPESGIPVVCKKSNNSTQDSILDSLENIAKEFVKRIKQMESEKQQQTDNQPLQKVLAEKVTLE